MKFKIRFADKIVGIFVILAVAALIFVIILLGSNQRWFAKNYYFVTYFDSASGLAKNMDVKFKGFTIGRVSAFDLTEDDRVKVRFYIFDTYIDRVRLGSIVHLSVSPVPTFGTQFLFYAGIGTELLSEGDLIPSAASAEGKDLVARNLATLPESTDSIAMILNQVNSVMENLNSISKTLDDAFKGSSETSLGRTLLEVERTLDGAQDIPGTINTTIADIMREVNPILADLGILSGQLSDPDGTVASILNADGEVYTNLVAALNGISGMLRNLEKTTAGLPRLMPEVAAILQDVRTALKTAEDVLTSLTNNPLLKGGVPERVNPSPGGTSPRDLEF
ncbi:MAG: MlaD family protein [Treponema sp.]|jgi:phospholipid/cholesterol/gamma-HCH transport system substrate-binding protein|nr:MlaD family protein [Treponema sp.]